MSQIVIGASFGDEGKGLTTSFLCSQTRNPLVVRFNGGHQAGHTVVHEGVRHVFSSFGSGTLQNVPTYWSSFCTFYPTAFLNEYNKLLKHFKTPISFVDPLCPVTTPYDVMHNQQREKRVNHGSVGVGFGSTIKRQEDYYKLFVQDLFYENIMIAKLRSIAQYYGWTYDPNDVEEFIEHVKIVRKLIDVLDSSILMEYNPIFEGAQGILLDMDFGFFPNVTRSNTTTKNALQLYNSNEVYYVTRTYLTRHGNGYMPNEKPLDLKNNEHETNVQHEYQGVFRMGELDVELLNYALYSDNNFSSRLRKNLVITCNDQYEIDVDYLLSRIHTRFNKVYLSDGDSMSNLKFYK